MTDSKCFDFDDDKAEIISDALPETHDFEQEKILQGYFIGFEDDIGEHNSRVFRFETQHGIVAVWGSSQLNRLLETAEKGQPYEIEYIGRENTKNPEFKFKKYQVRKLQLFR